MSLRLSRCFATCSTSLVALVLSHTSHAQTVTIISQDRHVVGQSSNVADDGTPFFGGPTRVDAPAGDFSEWMSQVFVPGNLNINIAQDGGWNGSDTFHLNTFTLSIGGGGGPGTSATAIGDNVFSYTFQVNEQATYELNTDIDSALPVSVNFQLSGPGVAINDNSAAGSIEYAGAHGTLVPGTYTLTLESAGTVSYVGPAGTGGGGGANTFSLVITGAPDCSPDFNGSGSVTVQDIFDFLRAWFTGDPRADFDHSGAIGVQDIFSFLSAWFAGCP
jgi:hypothetical protein